MKKWNLTKKAFESEKNRNKYYKEKRKLKNIKSLDLEEINNSKNKEKQNNNIKANPKILTTFQLFKNPKNINNNLNKNNSQFLYFKKKVSHSPIKTDINLNVYEKYKKKIIIDSKFFHKRLKTDFKNIINQKKYFFKDNNKGIKIFPTKKNSNFNKINKNHLSLFNTIEETNNKSNESEYKNLNSDNIINNKFYLQETTLNYSHNTEVNNFIDELKNKINMSKKKIYELERRNKSNNIIDITNEEETIKIFNSKENKFEDSITYNDKNNDSNRSSTIKNSDSEFFSILRQNQYSEKVSKTHGNERFLSQIKVSNYPKSMIKTKNKIKNEIKKIYNINNIFSLIKSKSYFNIISNNYEYLFTKYLDNKSLLLLSSTNKIMFKNIRIILYRIVYEKLLTKRIDPKENFTKKILYSLFNHSSNKLKFRNKIQLKTKYNYYNYKSPFNDKIKQDLNRTFPQDASFNTNSNYKKLYNILTCYSNYNKLIGYTQGLNFIVATCMFLFETEEEIFLFLDCLINRFNLEKYISIENKNLYENYNYFSNLLNKYIPDIIEYFEVKQLNHCFFSIGWMLTLFSNSMKRKYLIKTWCFMILFGWKFFYCLVIQILSFYRKEILSKEENKLSDYMKTIINDDNFCNNYNSIIKKTLCFMNDNIVL